MKIEDSHILAYIKKELPADHLRKYDELILSSSEFREKVKQAKTVYELSECLREQKNIDTEQSWNKLSRKIVFVSLRRKAWNLTRTAAAILVPLLLLYQFVIQSSLNDTSSQMITITSAPGIVIKTILPDGSEVWLNAQSELTYPQKFIGKNRNVQLKGEAYFKVVADEKHRFNVEMPGYITVSAFGTEFNINAYDFESEYCVTLARGNVEIETAMKKNPLIVGQKALIVPHIGEINIVQADTYAETAWKDGKMVFRREKLETIAQRISRKFGVVIHLEGDDLKDYEYTATFTDETLEDILELLKRSAPITYSITRQEQLENDAFTQRIITIKKN